MSYCSCAPRDCNDRAQCHGVERVRRQPEKSVGRVQSTRRGQATRAVNQTRGQAALATAAYKRAGPHAVPPHVKSKASTRQERTHQRDGRGGRHAGGKVGWQARGRAGRQADGHVCVCACGWGKRAGRWADGRANGQAA
eukprot:365246-Chlamydomonas_euryale.AAC.2